MPPSQVPPNRRTTIWSAGPCAGAARAGCCSPASASPTSSPGDYSGWNFGLAEGGFGGLAIATVLMGVMYACMVFSLAELSVDPAHGGRRLRLRAPGARHLGRLPHRHGDPHRVHPGARPRSPSSSATTSSRSASSACTSGWPVYLACFVVFIGIHLWGVGEALRFSFVVTGIAVAALLVFAVGAFTDFDAVEAQRHPRRGGRLRRQLLAADGPAGHLGGVPVRHVVLPRRRGRAAGRRGDQGPGAHAAAGDAAGPWASCVAARAAHLLRRRRGRAARTRSRTRATRWSRRCSRTASATALSRFVNYAGLAGLVASFFSLIYAGSRQLFALSRAGYLPRFLSLTSSRKAPYLGLLVPGAIGFGLAAATGDGARMLNVAVFGATISYALMSLSHIVLRRREPGLHRPYRTPGGMLTSVRRVRPRLRGAGGDVPGGQGRRRSSRSASTWSRSPTSPSTAAAPGGRARPRRSSRRWPRPRRNWNATDHDRPVIAAEHHGEEERSTVSETASGARPLIGISTYLEPEASWGVWQLPAALLPAGYPRLVQRRAASRRCCRRTTRRARRPSSPGWTAWSSPAAPTWSRRATGPSREPSVRARPRGSGTPGNWR